MIKVNYPTDNQEKKSFENEYFSLFKNRIMTYVNAIKDLKTKINSTNRIALNAFLVKYPFRMILVGDIETLVNIYIDFERLSDDIKSALLPIFTYDQPTISAFFANKNKVFNLRACHYCNTDTVHVYSELDVFHDALDFVKNGTVEQLRTIGGISKGNAEEIANHSQIEKDGWTTSNLTKQVKIAYDSLVKNNLDKKNHFTLDHFIPQSKCGLLAISLYNFVPSCYVCNCKLKGEKLLCDTNNISDLYKFSPTYDKFEENGEIEFSLLLDDNINIFDYNNNRAILLKQIKLKVDTQGGNKAPKVFRLKQRYSIHKDKAIRLAYLQERYSEQTLKEISNLLRIPLNIIKDDIFNLSTLENDSFSKLQKDIALQLGIK